jgi:dTMP kinase
MNKSSPARPTPWISIEGVDGAGKSSHIPTLIAKLEEAGFRVVSTREPGGTPLGERLREEILNTPMALETEVLLAFASRAEHLDKVIRPALAGNCAVVCDRFTDSTYAYQGAGAGYPAEKIAQLAQQVQRGEQPDLTLVFDVPPEVSRDRLSGTGKEPDKFESQGLDYFAPVRTRYLEIARLDPQRVRIIDSTVPLAQVSATVAQVVQDFLQQWGPAPVPSSARRAHP